MKQARELAIEAAKGIAAKASESPDKPLSDFVSENKALLNNDIPPFQWMEGTFQGQPMSQLLKNMPAVAAMGNPSRFADGVTIGNVPELNNVGEDFMKAVFTADAKTSTTALNQDGTVVYVVRPTEFTPSLDILREQFKQPENRNSRVVSMVSGGDRTAILNDFFKLVDEEAGYVNYTVEASQ